MNHRKHGLRAFGLCLLAALGLMAFSAAAAQAEDEFLINDPGQTLGALGKTSEPVAGEQVGTGRLIVPGKKIEIVCKKADVINATILPTVGHAEILYLECVTWTIKIGAGKHEYILETQLTKCEVLNDPSGPVGDITAKALLRPKLHNGEVYLEAEGTLGANELFASIHFKAGVGCALPTGTAINIKGLVCIQIDQLNQSPQHLKLSPTITLLLQEEKLPGYKLFYGENEAYVESEATATLVGGELAGHAWGAH